MFRKSQKSFTVIELLVVIAVIGLVTSIILVSVLGVRARARDTKRQVELDQIRKALEMYNISKGKYPTQDSGYCCIEAKPGEECQCDSFAGDIASYLPTVPEDPLYNPTQPCGEDKYGYQYKTENEGETYELYAKREQGGFFEVSSELGTVAYSEEGPGPGGGYPVGGETFSYRKKISINSSTGAGTNYQLKLLVGETSGAVGENFDIEEHCQNFPDDIRFTDGGGVTPLDHWLENTTGVAPNRLATFWVKITDNLDTNQDIYIYYGNPTASSASSITNTFIREINSTQPVKGSWHMDEGTGVTIADTSGNGNTGSITNATWTSGKFDDALSFDGADDVMDAGSASSLDNINYPITIEAWTYPTGWGEFSGYGYGRVADKGKFILFLHQTDYTNYNDHSLVFSLYIGGTSYPSNTPLNSISLDTWQHIAVSYDGSTVKMYINGVSQTFIQPEGAPSGNIDDHSANSYLIGDNAASARCFQGKIDEQKIYNRVLTQAEITDLYNNYGYTTTNYPGRVLVRKYISPEPSFSSAGSEETP